MRGTLLPADLSAEAHHVDPVGLAFWLGWKPPMLYFLRARQLEGFHHERLGARSLTGAAFILAGIACAELLSPAAPVSTYPAS